MDQRFHRVQELRDRIAYLCWLMDEEMGDPERAHIREVHRKQRAEASREMTDLVAEALADGTFTAEHGQAASWPIAGDEVVPWFAPSRMEAMRKVREAPATTTRPRKAGVRRAPRDPWTNTKAEPAV